MTYNSFILCTLLTFSICLHGISAMDYFVTNEAASTPGGIRFDKEIGIPYTKQIMGTSIDFIWHTVFQQNSPYDQKPLDSVSIYIVEYEGVAVAWGNNNINISSIFLQGAEGDLKWIFTSVFYHEMTHVFQWNGEGRAPSGLMEGVADYTKLKAGYAQDQGFAKPGQGDSWDQGYDVTARFLEYCDEIVPGFVASLNKLMRFDFDVKFFEYLTGKPVDQLWIEYKAKYGQ
ncbi:hypothetical protein Tco_0633202 [Tanacetum coccineum]